MSNYLFTSESVSEGHPDKLADQISDAVLDAILAQDKHARVACETLVKTGAAIVAGEITTSAWVDIEALARKVINDIGYNNSNVGFDGHTCAIINMIGKQSLDINLDMIVQNVSAAATGLTDISFTLPKTEGANATAVLKRIQGEIGFASIQYDDQIGKLSLIGAGMRSHPGVTATFFACLSEAGVNIEMISTSEIRISIVCRNTDLEKGVKAAHTAFDLDADQIEAVVYGGSGR